MEMKKAIRYTNNMLSIYPLHSRVMQPLATDYSDILTGNIITHINDVPYHFKEATCDNASMHIHRLRRLLSTAWSFGGVITSIKL